MREDEEDVRQRVWNVSLKGWLEGGGADPDIARILEGAAALASAAGHRDRAETARRLASAIVGK